MQQVLTMNETARYLRLNYCTLSRKVKNKEIPSFKVGSKILFRLSSLETWIAAQENGSDKSTPVLTPEQQRGVLRRVNA